MSVDTQGVDVESRAAERAAKIQLALAEVKGDIRGLPHDAAIQRLVAALRDHDVYLHAAVVRVVARRLADPWWAARHPLRAWRELRRPVADSEGDRFQSEADELARRVGATIDRANFSSVAVESLRTFDGMAHVVRIEPWSASLASRIVDAAAPISVDVRPMAPD